MSMQAVFNLLAKCRAGWPAFWKNYHNHVYGAISVVSLLFAVLIYLFPKDIKPIEFPPRGPQVIWPPAGQDIFPGDLPLRWQVSEAEGEPEKYVVEFSRDRDFQSTKIAYQGRDHIPLDQVFRIAQDLLREPFEPSVDAQNSRTIYWRVQAVYRKSHFSPWSTASTFIVYNNILERIAQTGRIIIGVSNTQEDMFSCVDSKGDWAGIDIDLVKELIGVLNAKQNINIDSIPEVRTFPWPSTKYPDQVSVWQAVQERKVDFLISAVTASEEREKEHGVKFSRPYFTAQQAIMTNPTLEVPNLDFIKGMRIGAQIGTTNFDLATHLETQTPPYQGVDSLSALLRDLENGRIDAVSVDEPYAYMRNRLRPIRRQFLIRAISSKELERVGYPGVKSEAYAIAVHRTESDLLRLIDLGLQELEKKNIFKILRQQLYEPSKCS